MIERQFFDKPARNARRPLTIDAAVGGMDDRAFTPGTGDRDIGQAALLFQ